MFIDVSSLTRRMHECEFYYCERLALLNLGKAQFQTQSQGISSFKSFNVVICLPITQYGNVRNVYLRGIFATIYVYINIIYKRLSRAVSSVYKSCVVTIISNFMLNFHSSVSVYRSKLYVRVGNIIIIIIVFLYTLNFF